MDANKAAGETYAISIVRVFDAPRSLVFRQWIEPDSLADWFAPNGYTVTACDADPRPGGKWHVTFRSAEGEEHQEYGEFLEVPEPERLVLSLTQHSQGRAPGPKTIITVRLVERAGRTEMHFEQTGYTSKAMRDGNAEGWGECFAKLDRRLEASMEQEIRALFEQWWRDAAAKDIDRVMAPIADDVISYEHEAPLQYTGSQAVREVCQRGFDVMQGSFTWTVPDLQVVVRGDLAVTWGLNHMQTLFPDGRRIDQWSRGTRIFRRIDNRWLMIHQHVSYPYDPATGLAQMELAPKPD